MNDRPKGPLGGTVYFYKNDTWSQQDAELDALCFSEYVVLSSVK